MIREDIKKVLSSVVVAIYLMVYAAPLGLCATMEAGVSKPALRAPVATTIKKAVAPTNPSASSSNLKLEGDISISKVNSKVNLSLRNSDVQQVLRMFADKAGLNIVFHSSVAGTVTLDLVDVPLNDAFKLVLQIADLTYYVDKNTMVVASSKAASTMNLAKQEMVSIPVKYVDAAVMADFLNKNIFSMNKPGLSNSQIATTNPTTNEVLIFGTDNDVRMAKKIIDKFDVKPLSNTFTVNHTTPKEMADLLCNVLLPQNAAPAASAAPAAGGSSPSGAPTGGAAPTNMIDSKAPSSSGLDNTSTNGVGTLALGAGAMACEYKDKISTGSLSSFNARTMAISYVQQRGVINVTGGSVQQVEMIRDFIAKNDKKQPQAYLEVSVIELSESGSREFKNTWKVWSENFAVNFESGSTTTNPLYPTFFAGDAYKLITDGTESIISKCTGAPTIAYTMSYLIKNGKGRVLANPRIMITNGQTSTIDLTSDYVKSVTSQVLTNAGALTPTVQRTYMIANDDGIKVSLVPFISPEGYVTLNIKPEYATIKERVYGSGATDKYDDLVATLLQRRNLDLKNVRIKDGETLVIGGMIREDETKTISKIPFLGDLPGIGVMFRNTASEKTKQELVIMLTPKIIQDAEDMVKTPSNTTL